VASIACFGVKSFETLAYEHVPVVFRRRQGAESKDQQRKKDQRPIGVECDDIFEDDVTREMLA
jgi:hypothetical protein